MTQLNPRLIKQGRLIALGICIALACFCNVAFAQSNAKGIAVSKWLQQIETIQAQLDEQNLEEEQLLDFRNALDELRGNLRDFEKALTEELDHAKRDLSALGPKAPDSEQVASDAQPSPRQVATRLVTELEETLTETRLASQRATQAVSNIADIRRHKFAEATLKRGPSPLAPTTWTRASPDIAAMAAMVVSAVERNLSSEQLRRQTRGALWFFVVAAVVAVFLIWPAPRWLLRRYGRDPNTAQPSYWEALRATIVVGATRALLPSAAALLIYLALIGGSLLTSTGESIAGAVLLGVVVFVWTVAFFRASFSPFQSEWRVVPVPTTFAQGIRWTVFGIALVLAIDIVFSEIISSVGARLAVTILRDFVLTATLSALLVVVLLRQRIWTFSTEPNATATPRWRSVRIAITIALVALVVLGALGYVPLARYVTVQAVLTGGLLLVGLVLYRLGNEFLAQSVAEGSWLGQSLRHYLKIDDAGAERFKFWVGLAYDTALGLFGLLIALFVWGADGGDVAGWVYSALFGFSIGSIRLSLVDVVVAILVFFGFVTFTRIIQRVLAERVLPQTQLDSGIQQSIKTSFGYVGLVIAAVASISALGLNLSSLAIVAGALSVGIGFGMQNVVNNFVSGLILLVERPVKVGDWVVVGDKQGYVKNIKVRATEIQTFDRASIFIPNSQLISEAVTNWTYADKMGRIIIPVGVAYGSNTKLVKEALLKVADAHSKVLQDPSPSVAFRGFGDSSLDFELRCFISDVNGTVGVTSDICFAIDDIFREEKIEIPFPQRDINLRKVHS